MHHYLHMRIALDFARKMCLGFTVWNENGAFSLNIGDVLDPKKVGPEAIRAA